MSHVRWRPPLNPCLPSPVLVVSRCKCERVLVSSPVSLLRDHAHTSAAGTVSLFYIKSHFQKNHIADDPEDWVWHTANTERIATLMFLEDAELRKELGRCDQVDLPIARATALQLRDSK